MDARKLHLTLWKYGAPVVRRLMQYMFKIEYEPFTPETPCLIISNHVTSWDPLLLAGGAPNHQMYFVASEHLFRKGIITKVLSFLVAPIARKKGSTGADAAMACLRHMRNGHSVCIFGEGEVTWNGESMPTFAGTGTLARASGANLVTYRFEGGHLTRPRWAKSIRRGKMKGHIVNVYTPETLKSMTPDEIAAAIDRDIHEDAYVRQAENPVAYKGSHLADRIEAALFLCPKCRKIGTLKGKGNRISCTCGYHTNCTEYGTFLPPYPFQHFKEWDAWQHENLLRGDFVQESPLFLDQNASLIEIGDQHHIVPLASGEMSLDQGILTCVSYRFPLEEITHMAIVQTNILLFQHNGKYYEIRTKVGVNLRKYLALWNQTIADMKA